MVRERSGGVAYVSRVVLRGGAPRPRLADLVAALEDAGADVRLDPQRRDLRFALPCERERWIVLGGLAELLERYADVATWDRAFEERWSEGDVP